MALSFLSSDAPKSKSRLKWLVVAVLAAIIAAVAIPQYLSGQWPWQSPPDVPQIRLVRGLKETGLSLEGWSEEFQQKIAIGGDQWSVQQLTPTNNAAPEQMILFLKPQGQSKDQPEVEWIDLKGAQKWQTSNHRRLRMGPLRVDTFRAWTSSQTFAVAQWYALPHGGHPAPHHWFWQDQLYQWKRGERLPWVAVSVLVPMPPLGDISLFYSDLEQLSQLVQTSLGETVFSADL
ncbi:cyanoexosortase B system-associated protein [Leptolyngbya cf. ectocarpi LEGE 11479]|uniref:Cyanoexosortase B system-associated protein n=1 Tax=Leptolyngbya cf. ectocarpi LEGE 11479 TaxID=1828722 RepID=A0A928X1V9_LEPEC|nr:cyanoexosortase B system-associated protein [Leptolyngbya ectocarpi]MBE9066276.1 cyanoexosortase B system-associated protein [Leptolyngbya cf. ectocarpi LEGE 11479]